MKRFQIYLDEKQAEKVRRLAFRLRVTRSEIIRRALTAYLEKKEG